VATPAQWLEGARPKTLPAAISPVVAGTGVAAYDGELVWWKALLALVVALALQVAVNYANDYSDGIRGTDDERVGPLRLTGSRVATPGAVKRAAFLAFGVAGVAGLALAASTSWWLVLVGVLCILAAWYYTGGTRPYGYAGLGEVMVFVFFGLVAVVGTYYVQGSGGRGRRSTPPSGSARWPARSSSPTTCGTSPPTPSPGSARSP
jgi:1,4-dihydroxy-2-naphthoate octaprenyltransferase